MQLGGVASIRWLLFTVCVLWVLAHSSDARRRISARRPGRDALAGRFRSSRGLRARLSSKRHQQSSWTTDPTLSASSNRLKNRLERLPRHRRLIPRRPGGILSKRHERRWLQEDETTSPAPAVFVNRAEPQHDDAHPTYVPSPRGASQEHRNVTLRTPVRHETSWSLAEYLKRDADFATVKTYLVPDVVRSLEEHGKEKHSTLFLPTDAVVRSSDYGNLVMLWGAHSNYTQLASGLRNIIDHHISVGKKISPGDVIKAQRENGPLVVRTRDTGANSSVLLEARDNEEGTSVDLYVDNVLVTEVVELRSVYVYKIGSLLYRRWNKGLTLADFVATNPEFTFFNSLVKNGGLAGPAEKKKSPITVFLVPDKDVTGTLGEMPSCIKTAVARKENASFAKALLNSLVVPGLWTFDQWNNSTELLALTGERLNITKVCESAHCPIQFLVNGAPLVAHNIPIYNGVAHVLSRLPALPAAVGKDVFVWDCMNTLCNECPNSADKVLLYVDQQRCEPEYGDNLPESGCVTRGSRPDWVCRKQNAWFPPGKPCLPAPSTAIEANLYYGDCCWAACVGWSAQEWMIHKKQNPSGDAKQVPERRQTFVRHGRVYYELLPIFRKRFPEIAKRMRYAHLELAGAPCQNHRRSYIRNFVRNVELWLH